jgi:hypothetical protein
MRLVLSGVLFCLLLTACARAEPPGGKVLKVLPHYLDLEGRHALSPSLYDRDAYQAFLRKNPPERSTVRFDIQWKSPQAKSGDLQLRIEMRGSKTIEPIALEQSVKGKGPFSHWSSVKLGEEAYRKLGDLIAWRVTLLRGEKFIAEERSFLW